MTNLMRDFKMMASTLTKRVKQLLMVAPVAALAACGTMVETPGTPEVVAYTSPDAIVNEPQRGSDGGVRFCRADNTGFVTFDNNRGDHLKIDVQSRPNPYGWRADVSGIGDGQNYTAFARYTAPDGPVQLFDIRQNGYPVADPQDSKWTLIGSFADKAVNDIWNCPLRAYHPYTVIQDPTPPTVYLNGQKRTYTGTLNY